MARSTTSRAARLTALALATGTLVVAATGSAGAATVKAPSAYGGAAQAASIHLEINLPAAVPVPGLGDLSSLTQDISLASGNTAQGLSGAPVAVSKAILGNGNVVVLSDALNKVVQSTLTGKTDSHDALASQDLGLIKLGVGEINSHVSPESATSTLTSSSDSSLASLRVGLAGLSLPTAVSAPITDALNTVANTVDQKSGTVTDALNGALNQLNNATQGQTAAVTDQIKAVETQVQSLITSLQAVLGNLGADTDLVRLDLLKSSESVTRNGAAVTALATSEVGNVDILGGLVHLDTIKNVSTSTAAGVAGSASSSVTPTIAHLSVADKLDLVLGPDGLTGSIGGTALPPAATDAVKTIISTLNGLLGTAGVEIRYGKSDTKADPAGQFASASNEGVGIVVNPLKAAKPLVFVQLVPASTSVNAAIVKAPTHVTPHVTTATPGKHILAHTGAELPLTAGLATVLVGLGAAARRRRASEI